VPSHPLQREAWNEATTKKQRLSPTREVEKSVTSSQRRQGAHTKPYGGEDPPSNLIHLPDIGKGIKQIPLAQMWVVWNSTLRDLDAWHKGLISDREGKSPGTNRNCWAGKWFIKYQFYSEIGVEIDGRLKMMMGRVRGKLQIYWMQSAERSNTTHQSMDCRRFAS
jgi:hypothetical protein